jgi:rhodanese-related sulfurtransferase
MKRLLVLVFALIFSLGAINAFAADDSKMLSANEKKVWEKACSAVPPEHQLNVEQFKKLYDEVMAGKKKAYLIDVRTHPEFYAFHIPYTDHIHAGHMYTIPKKIKDKDAMIVVWCRTQKKQCYVAEKLVEYGYTNVWIYTKGIVGWIKAGYPVCNEFAGIFQVLEYHKRFTETDKKTGKPKWQIREFHPY